MIPGPASRIKDNLSIRLLCLLIFHFLIMTEQSSQRSKITIVALGDNSSTSEHAFLHDK